MYNLKGQILAAALVVTVPTIAKAQKLSPVPADLQSAMEIDCRASYDQGTLDPLNRIDIGNTDFKTIPLIGGGGGIVESGLSVQCAHDGKPGAVLIDVQTTYVLDKDNNAIGYNQTV